MFTLIKNANRLIRKTRGRFLSLTAIVALGTAFFIGVSASSSVMARSVEAYDDKLNLKDITIYSNYGFDEDDIRALNAMESVELAEGSNFVDVIASQDSDMSVTRIHSYREGAQINQFVLKSGRLPENSREALADEGIKMVKGFEIGSEVELSRPDDDLGDYLNTDRVTIVGVIDTPLYLSGTRETSTLSNQQIRTFLYVPESAFVQDFYTEMNILLKDGKSYDSFSSEYEDYADQVKEELELLAATQADSRRQKIVDEAMEQYNDGLSKYEDGLQEYYDGYAEYQKGIQDYNSGIAEAQRKLIDAEQQIADGWAQLHEGEEKLVSAQAELDQARINYGNQIADGKAKLADGYRQLEEGKQEFAVKEAEYLAIRSQLSDALEQLNAPILDRSARLSFFMKDLCEEAQCLIRALLCYIGLDPENATVGDVSDYLNSNFNDTTIAAMNARIDEVIHSEDYIELIREDEEVEFDPEELIRMLKENQEEDLEEELEEMDTEDASSLNQADLEDSEETDTEEQKDPEDADTGPEQEPMEAVIDPAPAPAETQPAPAPEPVYTEPAAPAEETSAEEPVMSEPEPETPAELPEEVITDTPAEEPPAEEVLLVEQTAILDEDTDITVLETENAPALSKTSRTREVHHSIKCFDELIDKMGDSDPTFSQLMKFTVWPYMSVDTGVSILNGKARLLQGSGVILETVVNSPLPDEITIGTVALYNEQIIELRDQLGLTDSDTLGTVRSMLGANIAQIDQGLSDGRAELASAEAYLAEMSRQLEEGEAELNRKLEEGQAEINDGWTQIEENRIKLYDAQKELSSGYAEFARERANGLAKLSDARKELDDGWTELEDARVELEEAKEEIDSLDAAEWTILDRSQHYASETYHQTVKQMQAIARIFPVFFIAVAALVCLTTMTRMVNEERGQIGIFRALGFTKSQCSFTYLYYAGLASLIGTLLGSGFGLATFPAIIYNTWRMLYILPKMRLNIPWAYVIGALVIFFLMMEGVTLYVLSSDMRDVPAAILRPKAPKLGKDILLEKITLIWDHLSFSWKVTIRNLFRYKRRMVMTVFGVAGCSALLVTGFGIADSINDILDIQFYEVDNTNASVELTAESANPEGRARISREIKSINGTEEVYSILSFNGKVWNSAGKEEVVYNQTFKDNEELKQIYNVRERITKEELQLENGSVIISEKLSENLGLGIGDTITVESFDGVKKDVPISGIMEMYVFHYLLMSEDTYRGLYGSVPEDNTLYISVSPESGSDYNYINKVSNLEGVAGVYFNDTVMDNFTQMIKGINAVVLVLILSSMALAFVVLGNLTNVNISERLREIATLKVLGFRSGEVQNYIYKENNVLVAAGAVAGLPIGMVLHRYIMREVELSNIMFGRSERMMTFVYAFALTVVFGLLVNFFMRKKLTRIQMVESLKSVE